MEVEGTQKVRDGIVVKLGTPSKTASWACRYPSELNGPLIPGDIPTIRRPHGRSRARLHTWI